MQYDEFITKYSFRSDRDTKQQHCNSIRSCTFMVHFLGPSSLAHQDVGTYNLRSVGQDGRIKYMFIMWRREIKTSDSE